MAHDHLRAFLAELPLLSETIEAELAAAPAASANSDDVRKAHDAAMRRVVEFLKTERLPYAQIHYPEVSNPCPECGVTLAGAYWELSHPMGRGVSLPHLGFHLFVRHGRLEFEETLTNLAGTTVGQETIHLDVAGLARALDGISLPADAARDLAELAVAPRSQA
jgi:uncharacterized protein (UPF0212 family)